MIVPLQEDLTRSPSLEDGREVFACAWQISAVDVLNIEAQIARGHLR